MVVVQVDGNPQVMVLWDREVVLQPANGASMSVPQHAVPTGQFNFFVDQLLLSQLHDGGVNQPALRFATGSSGAERERSDRRVRFEGTCQHPVEVNVAAEHHSGGGGLDLNVDSNILNQNSGVPRADFGRWADVVEGASDNEEDDIIRTRI
ncbi:hypothetical protein NE237_029952 [Protea cynaroides]|uniref:Uncharacterized protein n=1 Tax=Protea cynaroides TaxID=273540 RepID=A0A9Q0JWJ2_9MAGN|nr:hypothetical protein NE237_029952 [Protea cynaroides]